MCVRWWIIIIRRLVEQTMKTLILNVNFLNNMVSRIMGCANYNICFAAALDGLLNMIGITVIKSLHLSDNPGVRTMFNR